MRKKIQELKPGEKFIDTLGQILEVEKIGQRRESGIERSPARIKVQFKTPHGNSMVMDYFADREVRVVNK